MTKMKWFVIIIVLILLFGVTNTVAGEQDASEQKELNQSITERRLGCPQTEVSHNNQMEMGNLSSSIIHSIPPGVEPRIYTKDDLEAGESTEVTIEVTSANQWWWFSRESVITLVTEPLNALHLDDKPKIELLLDPYDDVWVDYSDYKDYLAVLKGIKWMDTGKLIAEPSFLGFTLKAVSLWYDGYWGLFDRNEYLGDSLPSNFKDTNIYPALIDVETCQIFGFRVAYPVTVDQNINNDLDLRIHVSAGMETINFPREYVQHGSLWRVNLIDRAKWDYSADEAVRSTPAIGNDNKLYFGSWDGNVYALNPDGSKKWAYATDGLIDNSSPALGSDGTIYIGSTDGKLYALNPDGSKKWAYASDDKIMSSPALGSDETIYIGSTDGKLYALNPDGSKKWAYATDDEIISSPALDSDGTIYIGSTDGKLYALNPDGSKKWAYATDDEIISSPALGSDGTVYIGSSDGKLYAMDKDGNKKWFFSTGDVISTQPAIGANGMIYVGSWDGNVYALNHDGSKKWAYATDGAINISTPAIGANGTIYVGSEDFKLYALDKEGKKIWDFSAQHRINSSPTIGADGTIYFGDMSGKVYAIEGLAASANTPWPMFQQNKQNTGQAREIEKPHAPVPVDPGYNSKPGEKIETLTPTFTWETVAEADSYDLFVSKEPYGPENIIYDELEIYGNTHTISEGVLEPDSKYRWNMLARNEVGISNFSERLYFQTEGIEDDTVPFAVTPSNYDDMGQILTKMNRKWDEVAEELKDYELIKDYQAIFLNCGFYIEEASDSLEKYVSEGGALYASDFAIDFIMEAFPGYIDLPENPRIGVAGAVDALITDEGLANYLDSDDPPTTIELYFNLNQWVVIDDVADDVRVHLRGDFETTTGEKKEDKPLLVSFQHGEGRVVFTSFHNNPQIDELQENLLEYLVLVPETSKISSILESYLEKLFDFESIMEPNIDTLNEGESRKYKYEAPGGTDIVFAANWEGSKMKLSAYDPEGNLYDEVKDTSPPISIHVDKAAPGEWEYAITAKDIPYDNYPFVIKGAELKTEPPAYFSDVPVDSLFHDDIIKIVDKGIAQGIGGDKFGPDLTVTRGQMASFITNWLGLDSENPGSGQSFDDVGEERIFYGAIMAIVEAGIASGYGDGTFGYDDPVKRGQMARFLSNALDLDTDAPADPAQGFDDVAEGKEFYGDIMAIVEAGIASGYGDGIYGYNDEVKRGQMAAFLVSGFDLLKPDLEVASVKAADNATLEVEFAPNDFEDPYKDVSFEFEGDTVEEADVTWLNNVAILTVNEMYYGYDYTVDVFDDGVEVVSKTLTFDAIDAGNIKTEAIYHIIQQVGTDVSIIYTLEDTAGNPMKGLELRLRVQDADGNDLEKEEIVTTDQDGEATLTYTSLDVVNHNIEAKSVAFPTVYNDEIFIEWTEQKTDLIEIENNNIVLGSGTYRTYTATFYDKNGILLEDGEDVYVKIKNALMQSGNTLLHADGDFEQNGTEERAIATLNNGDGTATLIITKEEVTGDEEFTLLPRFYYGHEDHEYAEAITAAGATTFVEPEFCSEQSSLELKEYEELEVAVGEEITFTFTLNDQFGNPFIGALEFDFYENLDQKAATSPGSVSINIDRSQDGLVDDSNVEGSSEFFDLNDEGLVDVILANGSDQDTATLLVWFDQDDSSEYSKDQLQLLADTVSFGEIAMTYVEINTLEDQATINPAGYDLSEYAVFEVVLLDQNGSPMPDSVIGEYEDLAFNVLDEDGEKIDFKTQNAINYWIDFDLEKGDGYDDWISYNGFGPAPGDTAVISSSLLAPESQLMWIYIDGDELAGVDSGTYSLRAYVDTEGSGEFFIDFEYDIAEFDLEVEKIIKAEMNDTESPEDRVLEMNYSAILQDGTLYDIDEAAGGDKVMISVENKGSNDYKNISPGDKEDYKGEISAYTSGAINGLDSLDVVDQNLIFIFNAANEQAKLQVKVELLDSDEEVIDNSYGIASAEWLQYDKEAGTSEEYNGDVVYYFFDSDAHEGWYIIETSTDFVLADFETEHAYLLDGSTVNSEQFGENLEIGHAVRYNDDNDYTTHELTTQ